MGSAKPIPVTLISDATGSLGEHVLQALFTQFPPDSFQLRKINFVNSEPALAACLGELQRARGIVVHATIYEEYKRRIETVCRERALPTYDLTGPIMQFFIAASGRKADVSYRRLHDLSPDYFRKVGAIQFAIEHDDGRNLRTLDQADIVLTGVSRTTKTPTSMVLAMSGYRTANVPLVLEMPAPAELLNASPQRVVCLTMDPEFLAAIRVTRVKEELGFDGRYADEQLVRQELELATRLSKQRTWRLLDVTGSAVEETAARVLELVGPSLDA